jgi:hypothetical protein
MAILHDVLYDPDPDGQGSGSSSEDGTDNADGMAGTGDQSDSADAS